MPAVLSKYLYQGEYLRVEEKQMYNDWEFGAVIVDEFLPEEFSSIMNRCIFPTDFIRKQKDQMESELKKDELESWQRDNNIKSLKWKNSARKKLEYEFSRCYKALTMTKPEKLKRQFKINPDRKNEWVKLLLWYALYDYILNDKKYLKIVFFNKNDINYKKAMIQKKINY